jgi:hypothetical protein
MASSKTMPKPSLEEGRTNIDEDFLLLGKV